MSILTSDYFYLFLIMALGLLLGKVKIKGISLDVAAVIFVALVFGHFGVVVADIFQTVGLILFVFSVGIQSGPGFVGSFRKNVMSILLPAGLIIVSSAALMLFLSWAFDIDLRLALGLFTGARSSNSALAVAVESTASFLPALGHSISYPIGVISIIAFVRLLPLLLKADLAQAEIDYRDAMTREHPSLITKTYAVQNPNIIGKTLDSLHFSRFTGVNVSRIMHDGEIAVPTPKLVIHQNDLIKAVGLESDLENVKLFIGPEVDAADFVEMPEDIKHDAQWVLVTNKSIVNKTLAEIGLIENFSAAVTRLKRNGVEITPHSYSVLRYGDLMMVVCGKKAMPEVKNFVGDGKASVEMDFIPITVSIVLGLLVGAIEIPLGPGIDFSLGMTGGVLITALTLSYLGKTGPILWQVSESSTRFVRQLGLLFFLTAVGTSAGSHLAATFTENGAPMVVGSILLAVLPLALTAFVCRFILHLNVLTILGLISGGTTCSPALAVASSMSQSNVPNVAYATVYPFAMIFMMACAQILAVFMT
jgi:putative transport protein